jgi:putative ABC transport system permease protein
LTGVPTLYTTYRRATEYIPTTRFKVSYILLKPRNKQAEARSSNK